MVKRIGKIFFVFLLFFLSITYGLELAVIDKATNKSVTTLTQGQSYTLELKAQGDRNLYNVTIPGLEKIYHEFCGASHLDLMSNITTIHSYVIRPDNTGFLTIGPVELNLGNGTSMRSNILRLKIIEKSENNEIQFFVNFDKEKAVIGQKIQGVIQFCTSNPQLQLIDIGHLTLDTDYGECTEPSAPTQKNIILNGKKYRCYEFFFNCTFKRPGTYKFPRIEAFCRTPVTRNNVISNFSFMMQSYQDFKHYSLEPQVLYVDSLPAHDKTIHAVGRFDDIQLIVDRPEASIGEGVVARLIIKGSEGLDMFRHLPLQLPEGIKYYDSHATLDENNKTMMCEYILQGVKEGKWIIPPQELVYYDVHNEKVTTLTTQKLILTIQKSPWLASSQPTVKNQDEHNDDEDTITILEDYIRDDGRDKGFSWYIFFSLIFLPAFGVVGVKRTIKNKNSLSWLLYKRKRNAFKICRKKIKLVNQTHNITQLYDIFQQLFLDRFCMSVKQINEQEMHEILKKAGFISETIEQWNRFIQQLAEYTFFKPPVSLTTQQEVFKRALLWVDQLEEKL